MSPLDQIPGPMASMLDRLDDLVLPLMLLFSVALGIVVGVFVAGFGYMALRTHEIAPDFALAISAVLASAVALLVVVSVARKLTPALRRSVRTTVVYRDRPPIADGAAPPAA